MTHSLGSFVVRALAAVMLLSIGIEPQQARSRPDVTPAQESQTANAPGLRLTGKVEVSTVDNDGDGLLEAAIAHVEVEVLTAAEYTLVGTLEKNGRAVSHRPAWSSALFSSSTLSAAPGIHRASLAFSGEEIFRSGEDGPYDLVLDAIGADSAASLKVKTPFFDHRKFGEVGASIAGAGETAVDGDGDGRLDAIKVTADVTVRVTGPYRLDASLSKDSTTLAYASELFSLTAGTQKLEMRVPALPLLRSGVDGPYEGTVVLSDAPGGNLGGADFLSRAYASADFEPFLQTDGRFQDRGIDTNGNGLLDLLRIELRAAVDKPGPYVLSGQIRSLGNPRVVFAEAQVNLTAEARTVTLDFRGPLVRDLEIDGPYEVELVLRDPTTHDEVDRIRLGNRQRTAAYRHIDFEPFGWSLIKVTGHATDKGVDSDGNGLFEELRVEVEVELAKTDIYEWHATLKDAHGTNIDWDRRTATLQAGKATIDFAFEGKKIRENGVDGPYSVKALGMFGRKGPNVVVPSVGQTRAYSFTTFER